MKWWALLHYIWEPHVPKNPAFFPPLFSSSLHPACPSFSSHPTSPHPLHAQQCVKNSSADKADLSFCHGGREGRQTVECPGTGSREGLWALRYASLRPPLLHPPSPSQPHSLSACFHDPCSALGGTPPPPFQCLAFLLSYLYQPNLNKPSERWPTAQNCKSTVPVLTWKPTPPHLLRGRREAAAWPGLTDFQLWSPVTPNNTLPDNQIGDKLQDKCAAWE